MRPILQALVLADHVYTDRVTGKNIIAGTFHGVLFSRKKPIKEVELPDRSKHALMLGGVQSGSPYLYMSLTDVCEGTKLQLQFVNLTKNAVLLGTEIRVDSKDRLQTIEVVLPLPALPIQEPGSYSLEVLCEGEILGSHRLKVEEVEFG